MNDEPAGFIELLLPIIILAIPCAIVAGILAHEKGRNVILWVVLTFIPFINFFTFLYIVGAPSLRLERKIDEVLAKLNSA